MFTDTTKRILKSTVLLVCVTAFESGCSSISAVQRPINSADLSVGFCPSRTDLEEARGKQGAELARIRDEMISQCVKAINRGYTEFKINLHRESTGTRVVTGILSASASAVGTFAKPELAKRLAAGNAALVGASATLDKEAFYQQTLPAIEASMDANRDRILKRIVDSQLRDPNAISYSLVSAGFDLDAYQQAGNIYAAITELTTTASREAADARDERMEAQTAVLDLGTAVRIDAGGQARLSNVAQSILGLTDDVPGNARLNVIASGAGLTFPPSVTTFDAKRAFLIQQLNRRVRTTDEAEMERQLALFEQLVK